MIGDNLALIEMGFTGIVVLGFLVYQYWATNRAIARDRAAREAAERASDDGAGHPKG